MLGSNPSADPRTQTEAKGTVRVPGLLFSRKPSFGMGTKAINPFNKRPRSYSFQIVSVLKLASID